MDPFFQINFGAQKVEAEISAYWMLIGRLLGAYWALIGPLLIETCILNERL